MRSNRYAVPTRPDSLSFPLSPALLTPIRPLTFLPPDKEAHSVET